MVIGIGVAILFAYGVVAARAEPAVFPQVTAPDSGRGFGDFIAEASQRFGIPAAWIRAVMRAESFGDVRATSPRGAIGLMQIMPKTWAELRQRYHLGADPYDAHDNIIAGAGYLRELHDRYGVPGFLAAYNAGPGRWEDHLASGRALPLETRAYLARLAPAVAEGAVDDTVLLGSVVKSWTEASLFPPLTARKSTDRQSATQQPSGPSTNDRRAQDWTGLAPQSGGLFVAVSGRDRSQ
ncbi:MAG TPA: lytic transglycosylase domain-containing protein [Acidiphilium sp.]|nr:lytic transglycosylase domain-containing protein [Acidiphilium sp.]